MLRLRGSIILFTDHAREELSKYEPYVKDGFEHSGVYLWLGLKEFVFEKAVIYNFSINGFEVLNSISLFKRKFDGITLAD